MVPRQLADRAEADFGPRPSQQVRWTIPRRAVAELAESSEECSGRRVRSLCDFCYEARGLVSCFAAAVLAIGTAAAGEPALAGGEDAAAVDFFERHIRPALIEHCLECHSNETDTSGGLALDSRAGWMTGGDLGAAVVPGDPDNSLLMRAIRYDDPDLQMPPEGKLDDETLQAFARWIEAGAVDPRTAPRPAAERATGLPVERATEHWAYRPLEHPGPPSVSDQTDAAQAIDAFISAKLQEQGLTAAGPAGKRELIRRLSYDLRGLPPTPEEIAAFENDTDPGAKRRLIERLLASHHFGEHFARRWMDVARYAESVTLRGLVMPEAWRYRDYLIMAFAEDRPFDQMIRDQLAGDLLRHEDLEQRQWSSIATGFLGLGNSNLEDQDKTKLDFDHIDEQLETMGRAFLAQTIGCARCHDHKFDPIPTSDYYALAGILRSTEAMEHSNVSRWIERPLPLAKEDEQRFAQWASELRDVEAELKELESLGAGAASRGRVPVAELAGVVVDDEAAKYVGEWSTSASVSGFVGNGYRHDGNSGQGEKTVTFEPQDLPAGTYRVRMSYTASSNRASNVRVQVFSANESVTLRVNQRRQPKEQGLWHSLGEFPFEAGGQAFVMVSNQGANGHVIVDAVQFLPVDEAADQPGGEEDEKLAELAQRRQALVAEQKRLQATLDSRPKYLTVVEAEPLEELEIRIRGNVHSHGPPVPRGFLTAVPPAAQWSDALPADRSGRRELAEWIADPRNPLTARVYANRVWSWLMGDGLVATENNFGTTGTEPSHPELLDWLASELIRSGWSTKHLVRTIVSSDAYQRQLVTGDHPARAIDPDNRGYWSAHLKRLPVESLRDAMLQVSGELDRRVGGSDLRPGTNADYGYSHGTVRRSVYAPVLRNAPPPLFRVFDFADSSVSVGQRARSTVATQSLALMNSPWVVERSAAAARRWSRSPLAAEPSQLIEQVYQVALGRSPTAEERRMSLEFLGEPIREDRLQAWIHSLFASIDFRFLD